MWVENQEEFDEIEGEEFEDNIKFFMTDAKRIVKEANKKSITPEDIHSTDIKDFLECYYMNFIKWKEN